MNNRFKLLFCLLIFPCLSLWAWDFGLLLNQNAGYGGLGSDGDLDYSIGVVPRISGLIGSTGDFIVSAGLEADYNNGWGFVPELLRTELSFHPGNWAFEIGRMYNSDPLGFVAEGLFDGVKVAYNSEVGTFSVGAWYTGLLYKKRANIGMTAEETEADIAPLDYGDFAGTYFAPRRFLGALAWEHLGGAVQARVGIFGQFDFFSDKPLNSQYAALKLTLPVNAFTFDLGGCLELIENGGGFDTALAAETRIAFTPPLRFKNRLSLLARYASGNGESGQLAAFLPFTTRSQGDILKVKLSGLSILSLDYVIRLHPAFSAGLTSTCFIRNDLGTYTGYPLPEENSKGYFLGNEFFARFLWSPASDLQVNLGGGLFLPSLGDAAPKAENFWRVEINVIFSLL
ncbi:MAG: hypothetical protein LBC52_04265 [Treponema sp.]|jgi:hypothetical protein|nr:hypothetical protein [Treponema sp.]